MIFFTPIKLPLQPTDMSLFDNSIFPTIKRKISSCRNPTEHSTSQDITEDKPDAIDDEMETKNSSLLRDVYGSKLDYTFCFKVRDFDCVLFFKIGDFM